MQRRFLRVHFSATNRHPDKVFNKSRHLAPSHQDRLVISKGSLFVQYQYGHIVFHRYFLGIKLQRWWWQESLIFFIACELDIKHCFWFKCPKRQQQQSVILLFPMVDLLIIFHRENDSSFPENKESCGIIAYRFQISRQQQHTRSQYSDPDSADTPPPPPLPPLL